MKKYQLDDVHAPRTNAPSLLVPNLLANAQGSSLELPVRFDGLLLRNVQLVHTIRRKLDRQNDYELHHSLPRVDLNNPLKFADYSLSQYTSS